MGLLPSLFQGLPQAFPQMGHKSNQPVLPWLSTLSPEVLAAIIAPIAALALALMCILVMVVKERSGKPMFTTLPVEASKV